MQALVETPQVFPEGYKIDKLKVFFLDTKFDHLSNAYLTHLVIVIIKKYFFTLTANL